MTDPSIIEQTIASETRICDWCMFDLDPNEGKVCDQCLEEIAAQDKALSSDRDFAFACEFGEVVYEQFAGENIHI